MKIKGETIYKTVYELCARANVVLDENIYKKLANYKNIDKTNKNLILKNAKIAFETKRPLCQDTGTVTVFIKMSQNTIIDGDFIEDIINKAIEDSYRDNFFRKSTCIDAFSNRNNNGKNTPAIIHIEFTKKDKFEILVGIKGGGAENTSQIKMFSPTANQKEIFEFIKNVAKDASKKSCPPLSLGIGIGGTIEKCAYLAKKALYFGKNLDIEIDDVFETKILTSEAHIASLPVCVNVNCHSARYASATIKDDTITFKENNYDFEDPKIDNLGNAIHTSEIEKIKNTKKGEKVLLSGTIYTARDMAHKKLIEMIENNEKLPIELKNTIIFYAGPCPKNNEEVTGPIGPTTSYRMDKFAPVLFKNGALASIGKGDRGIADGIYFKALGGIASYMKNCIISSEIVAFEEFGAEAIYKLEIKDLPLERG